MISKNHTCGLLLLLPLMLCCLPCLSYAEDSYEPDNDLLTANKIIIDNGYQLHDFHGPDDQDWVKFYAFEGEEYTVEALNDGDSHLVLELFNEDGQSIQKQNTPIQPLADEIMYITDCPADGVYYLSVYLNTESSYTGNNDYRLKVFLPVGPVTGTIQGVVVSKESGQPVGDVIVKTDRKRADISLPEDGSYRLVDHPPDDFELETESGGKLLSYRVEDYLLENGIQDIQIELPRADLTIAITILRTLTGFPWPFSPYIAEDVNGDGEAGLAEVIHILQLLTGQS